MSAAEAEPQTREHIFLPVSRGTLHRSIFKQSRPGDDEELWNGEMEVRELLSEYEFPGDDIPIIAGSALKAMECGCGSRECEACGPIWKLMDNVDSYIPTPQRDKDKPFLMPIEDVFTITGRGTVVTGRVERGQVKVGDQVHIVGLMDEKKQTVVTVWKCSVNS